MLAQALLPLLNRLLREQSWAREQLREYADQVAVLRCGVATLRFRVDAEGMLTPVDDEVPPAVELILPASALAELLTGEWDGATRQVVITGNARFAETLSLLLKHLRPDIGGSLSPFLGDILANRAERGLSALSRYGSDLARRSQEGLREYFAEEAGWLLKPQDYQNFCQELQTLQERLSRLEQRVDKL